MTEDIFFCYNAKEAPEREQNIAIKIKGRRKKEATSIAKSFLLTGIEQSKQPDFIFSKSILLVKVTKLSSNHPLIRTTLWSLII